MPGMTPLPERVRRLLGHNTHPGLMLDKYVESWDPAAPPGKLSERVQRPAVEAVVKLSRQAPPGFDLAGLLARRRRLLEAAHALVLPAVTAGPLTLHLARASALENAGICLHPLYGFVYLPGSGVKGLAHAHACEVWLPAQADRAGAWKWVCAVFGWAPSPWLHDLARRLGVKVPEGSCAGAIVFHEAWPESWPPLTVDILNNHHAGYYQKGEPPGDWDSPIPVYFLSVPAGPRFSFGLSKRFEDAPDDLLDLAGQWLAGGLVKSGAGAKTATGYGAFKLAGEAERLRPALNSTWEAAQRCGARAEFACELELVTPAFLAGARQQAEDCELRPASLRGLLRWWWRTLHAGFVDVPALARMEAAVWGDTAAGGAVRLTVLPVAGTEPLRFDKHFVRQRNGLPTPRNNKTTQGLWYHSFGMDDTRNEGDGPRRHQRWFAVPGARWEVRLVARPSLYPADARRGAGRPLDAALLLNQAKAALALFCRLGGIGSKARKGFASFADPAALAGLDPDACKQAAAAFRQACAVGGRPFDAGLAESLALEQLLPFADLPLTWTNYWFALDQVGDMAQRFAQGYPHRNEKKALGLPRTSKGGAQGAFRPGKYVKDRHASPVLYHFARDDGGGLVLRVAAFPAQQLPDPATSQRFLEELLQHLRSLLPERVSQYAQEGRRPPVNPPPPGPDAGAAPRGARAAPAIPKANDRVEAELLAEKTRKGGWMAKHSATGLAGPIVNSADVPGDSQPGAKVTLIVAAVLAGGLNFRYPTAADQRKPTPAQSTPPPQPRGRPRGRR